METDVQIRYRCMIAAKDIYSKGRNVSDFLRNEMAVDGNSKDIIEIAYDLQSGSYVEYACKNLDRLDRYAEELANILDGVLEEGDDLLDVGTGELTTISLVVNRLKYDPSRILAFDISWSRIFCGLKFAFEHMGVRYPRLRQFVGELEAIPLGSKSISVVTSSHALESNAERLDQIIQELFRVARDWVVLFEPCYEINSPEGQKRMLSLGYIRGLGESVRRLGGDLIDCVPITNVSNKLNPTAAFLIRPPEIEPNSFRISRSRKHSPVPYCAPGSEHLLRRLEGETFWFCEELGLCYPELKGVPILKNDAAILASALAR